jgi:hypothetical protein
MRAASCRITSAKMRPMSPASPDLVKLDNVGRSRAGRHPIISGPERHALLLPGLFDAIGIATMSPVVAAGSRKRQKRVGQDRADARDRDQKAWPRGS